jgi:hypothetical protein
MRKIGLLLGCFGLLAVLSPTTSAHAQATRTWVSGVGDDANPCSRTAPCKTFAGAISKTAAGGEIDCLDPGGFGAVTIVKSITIDCGTFPGGILAAGTNGVVINAAATDKVVLRNLVIQGTIGASPGINGIRWLAGLELELDRVVVQGFNTRGLDAAKSAVGILSVRNSYFAEVPTGIRLATTSGNIVASISNTTFNALTVNGVEAASAGAFANVSNSVFSALNGSAVIASASGATAASLNNVITNCGTGVNASVSGAKIIASGNQLIGNSASFAVVAGATFVSGNDNKLDINPGPASTSLLTVK